MLNRPLASTFVRFTYCGVHFRLLVWTPQFAAFESSFCADAREMASDLLSSWHVASLHSTWLITPKMPQMLLGVLGALLNGW